MLRLLKLLKPAAKAAVAIAIAAIVALMLTTNHSYVTTTSMYPTIPPGSMIFIQHEPAYRVGDVIEFRGNGLIWAHRIIAIKPGGIYQTKGDNPVSSPDIFTPAITKADVIGKVVAAPHWLGFPELIAHSPAYGLSWLRYELGLAGRLGLLLAAIGFSALLLLGRRPRSDARDGCPRQDSNLRPAA